MCSSVVSPEAAAAAPVSHGLTHDDAFFGQLLTVPETLLEAELFGPGPAAMRLLETLDRRPLTPAQAVEVAAAWERQSRWLAVRRQQATLAVMGPTAATSPADRRDDASRRLELALVTDCAEPVLADRVREARLLGGTLRATRDLVEGGELSEYRARRIAQALSELPAAEAQQIEAAVLPTAAQVALTSLLARLRRAVLAVLGPEAVQAYQHDAADRTVDIDTQPETVTSGLLGLHAYLPADTTVAIRDALDRKAKQLATADRDAQTRARRAGATSQDLPRRRTRDQRLADALAWFILGPDPGDPSRPGRPHATVQVTLALPTLLGLRDNPGELVGYGPIPADIARRLAADGDWQRFIHEPVTGHLLDAGRSRYRPPPAMLTFTRARDVTSRFPGSGRTAALGDADHVHPYHHGGTTSTSNLAMLCRIGHTAKTHNGWHVTGDANTTLTWTSPNGTTWTTHPHDYRDDPLLPDIPPF